MYPSNIFPFSALWSILFFSLSFLGTLYLLFYFILAFKVQSLICALWLKDIIPASRPTVLCDGDFGSVVTFLNMNPVFYFLHKRKSIINHPNLFQNQCYCLSVSLFDIQGSKRIVGFKVALGTTLCDPISLFPDFYICYLNN